VKSVAEGLNGYVPVGFAKHASVLSAATRKVESAKNAKSETGFEGVSRCLSVNSVAPLMTNNA